MLNTSKSPNTIKSLNTCMKQVIVRINYTTYQATKYCILDTKAVGMKFLMASPVSHIQSRLHTLSQFMY